MVAQVFNRCPGGVLLSHAVSGTGFQPVNPLRIIGAAGLNQRVWDGIGHGPSLLSRPIFIYFFLQSDNNNIKAGPVLPCQELGPRVV
jgi:hypothetical protein